MSYTFEGSVEGMTCDHCVASVTEELEELLGVTRVDLSLETGALVVTSDEPVEENSIRAAVAEAGYTLA